MLIACMMVMSGVNWLIIGGCGAGIFAIGVFAISFFSHAMARLAVWFDPFDPLYFKNDGWQPAQSLFAIASGGLWGVGLGQSNQKDGYIPEPQNDYIFSVICEEMGFDSLRFNRLDDMLDATGLPHNKLCTYCWSGKE